MSDLPLRPLSLSTADAAPAAAAPPDAATIRDCREGADLAGFHQACPDAACRRAGRCRGTPRASRANGLVMLPCLTALCDELFGPLRRWNALEERIAALEEARDALASEPAPPHRRGGRAPLGRH